MTAELVKLNPSAIVIEDLNVKCMFKNKHLSETLKFSKFGEVIRQLKYKCAWNGIKLITTDRWYPSSKLCSRCGEKKEKLSLSERVFVCDKLIVGVDYLHIVNSTGTLIGNEAHRESYQTILA